MTPEEYKNALKDLNIKRGTHKRKITNFLKGLQNLVDDEQLNDSSFRNFNDSIVEQLNSIKSKDTEIKNLMMSADIPSLNEPEFNQEIDDQSDYHSFVIKSISNFENLLNNDKSDSSSESSKSQSGSLREVFQQLKNSDYDAKPPPLNCPDFSGEKEDKLEFKTFLQQFKDVIDKNKNMSKTRKLTYLKNYLKGYAYKLVQHLSLDDANYERALKLLKDEFLDEPYIIDDILSKILKAKVNFEPTLKETKIFINEMRTYMCELQELGYNFLEDKSPGLLFMSHVVSSKLPYILKREFARKLGTNYPDLNQIFDHYSELIKTLAIVNNKPFNQNSKAKDSQNNASKYPTQLRSEFKGQSTIPSVAVQNFKVTNEPAPKQGVKPKVYTNHSENVENKPNQNTYVKYCKFCTNEGHTSKHCTTYLDYNQRVERCNQLKLCSQCTSAKHDSTNCPGNKNFLSYSCRNCQSKSHIEALCPNLTPKPPETNTNLCLCYQNESDGDLLLPTLTAKVSDGKNSKSVRFLIDTGSQRSYVSSQILDGIANNAKTVTHNVKTFIGLENREFKEMPLQIYLNDIVKPTVPVLVDKNFKIEFVVNGVDIALKNLNQNLKYELADSNFNLNSNNSKIELHGILGADVIAMLPQLKMIKCMGGAAFKLENGSIIPFGNVGRFIFPNQISEFQNIKAQSQKFENQTNQIIKIQRKPSSLSSVTNEASSCQSSDSDAVVNFVVQPYQSYFSPLSHLKNDSDVEQGLENMFKLESLGLTEKESESLDQNYIQNFKEKIEFQNGKYHIALPWKEDKLKDVPSNAHIALKVLDRVTKNLEHKNLTEKYDDVFQQQLQDDIIEKIEVQPKDYNKHVWIPHRPVIKTDAQTTTKIRPVFNCSLKINDKPSLNEAAYTGVNLMSSLLKLLLQFRSNKYVLLSDVKQAFLQIKLKDDADKNKFSFFWKKDNELVQYRYKTIVFGYTSSPFILNYVIKHHADQYPDDYCKNILQNNFYVDNLIVTDNDLDKVKDLYVSCNSRMEEGGFNLRSWNTNCHELKDQMVKDDRYVQHGCTEEKVLGYKYLPDSDMFKLSDFKIDQNSKTKRQILAQISKVFDPLGLFLPVSLRGKLLMREIWKSEVGWDSEVSNENIKMWLKLKNDLDEIKDVQIPRCGFLPAQRNKMMIFCDASNDCYGFTVYIVGETTNLVFAKTKVAPIKPRSLPTLELLSVYLATQCLESVLDSFSEIKFEEICIFVDAQIVLSWILTGQTKNKNVFINNRIRDILEKQSVIEERSKTKISYNYILTDENPADLITRGITSKQFKEKMSFWLHGPEWISKSKDDWPRSQLKCLSEENKSKTLVNAGVNENAVPKAEAILPFQEYSDFQRLLNFTSAVFKFKKLTQKSNIDTDEEARLYWIKYVQEECFPKELKFLRETPTSKEIPLLVDQLNLFLDPKGVLRSRGRIDKTMFYKYDVMNPILIGKKHHITKLIIEEAHESCQHLGLQTTINQLRTKGYWVPQARQSVKTVISNCVICKKYNGIPFKYPKITNLPKDRVNFFRPFEHVGVDYTGHYFVKDGDTVKKMYILIYTCLNIRAIHLDLVPDMSASTFLLSFQRFSNLYGICSSLYSDNARSFKKGGDVLHDSLTSSLFTEHLRKNNIKHIPIPLYAAWVGSTWERLIRVIKSCLNKTIGRSTLSYFELLTSLSTIKNVVNSRPLTYRSSNNDFDVISPNSFLKMYGDSNSILMMEAEESLWDKAPPDHDDLNAMLDVQNDLFQKFRELWYDSYLLSLREQSKSMFQDEWYNRIKIDDIVLVKMPNRTRPFWLLGRVLEVVVGYDNKI